MTTTFKIKCLIEIEGTITIPPKNFCVKNRTSLRLCYLIGRRIRYIHLPSLEDAAALLMRHGIIDSWAYVNDEVKMYVKSLVTSKGDNNQPVQTKKLVPITWEEIEITPALAQTFAAYNEFDLAGETIGIAIGKVVEMTNRFFRAA